MQSILSLVDRPNGKTGLHVDLSAFEAPMKTALKRATIFFGYAYHSSKLPPLTSVSLNSAIQLDVGVPDRIAPPERQAFQSDFTAWSIGQALVEIDQSYHRFVSSALDTLLRIDAFFENGIFTDEGKPDLANTWNVHEKFHANAHQKSTQHDYESSCLRSLGSARNCLVHDSGKVSKWRLTDDEAMPVKWIGRDMVQLTPNGERRILPRDRPFRVRKKDIGLQIAVEEVPRKILFRVGERVSFTQTDLSEIVFFYQYLAMQVGGEMHRQVLKKLGNDLPSTSG